MTTTNAPACPECGGIFTTDHVCPTPPPAPPNGATRD